jgi:uncharacterized membrane protein
MTQYIDIPQPDQIDIREKEDAMGAYFMMFAALAAGLPLPVMNLIAAIIYLFLNKKKSRFIHFHSLQSLLSQIPVSILNVALIVWLIKAIFFEFRFNNYFKGFLAMVIAANLIYIIFSIIAAVKARKGEFYYFLFFGRIAYHYAYKADTVQERKVVNQPPKM